MRNLATPYKLFIFLSLVLGTASSVMGEESAHEPGMMERLDKALAQPDTPFLENKATLKQAVIVSMRNNFRVMQAKERIYQAEHGHEKRWRIIILRCK